MATQVRTGLVLGAGTSTQAPLTFTSGTLLGTAAQGSEEYDGSFHYLTPDATSGRGFIPTTWVHRATAGSAVGPVIADFFATGSSINLAANSTYIVEYFCSFLKTTAGTINFNFTGSTALSLFADAVGSPAAGATTAGTPQTLHAGFIGVTNGSLPATASLTTGVSHWFRITATVFTATACNLRLRVSGSAGTITRNAESFYRVTRIPTTSTGSFAT